MMKKYNPILLATSLAIICNLSYADSASSRIKKLCETDSLNFFEALARNDWALRCGHISRRTYEFYLFNNEGDRRLRPSYPVFTKGYDFEDWFAAPRIKMAPCNTFGYSQRVYCTVSSNHLNAQLPLASGELPYLDAYNQPMQQRLVVDEKELDNLHYRGESMKTLSYTNSVPEH